MCTFGKLSLKNFVAELFGFTIHVFTTTIPQQEQHQSQLSRRSCISWFEYNVLRLRLSSCCPCTSYVCCPLIYAVGPLVAFAISVSFMSFLSYLRSSNTTETVTPWFNRACTYRIIYVLSSSDFRDLLIIVLYRKSTQHATGNISMHRFSVTLIGSARGSVARLTRAVVDKLFDMLSVKSVKPRAKKTIGQNFRISFFHSTTI